MATERRAGGDERAAHPEPPVDLHARALPLTVARGPWARAYRLERDPRYFGRGGDQRFDDPARTFGVCYCGDGPACAFIETLPAVVTLGTRSFLAVRAAALQARGWATVALRDPAAPLRLVDLTGPGLARLGAEAALSSCPEYAVPQRWSRALWSHPEAPDGLLYRARHDPSLVSLALFDRAEDQIDMVSEGAWASSVNRDLIGALVARYGVSLLRDDAS